MNIHIEKAGENCTIITVTTNGNSSQVMIDIDRQITPAET